MKQAAAALLLLVLGFGCASSDSDPMNEPRAGGRRGGWGGGRDGGGWQRGGGDDDLRPQGAAAMAGAEMMLPDDWWSDPQISAAVNLSADQYQRLKDLGTKQSADRERLAQDVSNAQRDFRLVLDAEKPSESDLEAAGKRLRDARDRELAQQVENVAEQRLLLTQQQWQALQDAIRNERRNRRDQRDGRGGYPGGYGGRRPGGMGGRRPY